MAEITIELAEDIAQFVRAKVEREKLDESAVLAELVRSGFEILRSQ